MLGNVLLLLGVCLSATGYALPSLQELIDQNPDGQVLVLEPGKYAGPAIISKPIHIDGKNVAIIDGGGVGTVITIKADGVTLENLSITNSGDSHDQIDASIKILSSKNSIIHNKIYETLFGIDMKEAHNNKIIDNEISSRGEEIGLRGDAIKAWASNNNIFKGNRIHDARDMVVWYSDGNEIIENVAWNNRYALHFMYAGRNNVRHNKYSNNAVGIFLMYSKDAVIEYNDISYSHGATGMGIGLKEVDDMKISFNNIEYSTIGIYLDQTPHKPYAFNLYLGNTIRYCTTALILHSTLRRNVFKGNAIIDNLEDMQVHANGTAKHNIWEGNYWSRYEGFDRDLDGYGDRAFTKYLYHGDMLIDSPGTRFFYGSPVLSLLTFLTKLAPFSEPRLLHEDKKPVFSRKSKVRLSAENLSFKRPTIEEMEDRLDDEYDDY